MTALEVGQWWCGEANPWTITQPYIIVNSIVTAVRYRDKRLSHLWLVRCSRFLLVQDDARPCGQMCSQFLNNDGIHVIKWPSRSPDLNPVEHLWDVMYRYIRRRQVPPQTIQEPTDALIQVWEGIPQDTICWLIRRKPRCEESGQTHYWATLWAAVTKFTKVRSGCDFSLFTLILRKILNPVLSGLKTLVSTDCYYVILLSTNTQCTSVKIFTGIMFKIWCVI